MINSIKEIEAYLKQFISYERNNLFPGQYGFERMKNFADFLGISKLSVPFIHIAGTSGKGSTATMISQILTDHQYRTGLSLSPHLLDIRDRIQINNRYINENTLVRYFNELIPKIKKFNHQSQSPVSYFEIMIATSVYSFIKEKVDFIILEVGLGGLFDGTNVFSSDHKIAVLTRIGLDHTQILGKTLTLITTQKAAIITEQSAVVYLNQTKAINKVIEQNIINKNAKGISISETSEINVNLAGDHQKENAGLAIEASKQALKSINADFSLKTTLKSLKSINFRARFDIQKINDKTIILDGAHNPQKMQALLLTLKAKYPNEKFIFIIAFKISKDYRKMIKQLLPFAKKIIYTNAKVDSEIISIDPKILFDYCQKNGFKNCINVPDNKLALIEAIKWDDKIIITGSLFLVANLYKLIYPRGG